MKITEKLKKMNNTELISIINELMKYNSDNRKFLSLKLSDNLDYEKLFEESKISIKKCFNNSKADIRGSKKILSDYKKLNPPEYFYLELFLFYLECGISYGQHRDMYSNFYYSFEVMFEKFINIIKSDSDLILTYKPKLINIFENSQQGYGHYDTLSELLEEIR